MENLQKTQNKLIRTLENVRLKDRNRTSDMLTKNKMLSVNQLQAQVKLTELWKAVNTGNNLLNFTLKALQKWKGNKSSIRHETGSEQRINLDK